ncbi:centrosomal protein of 55 kDa [Octopus bimaculoides]|uniref:TSG101 and ALIX binding domain-containing protein n=1 Tax=Octopus bimaculoides TaxID=37653 RepID=A0A0L8HTX0_OCTBM|nr:centrosomal protein of 55 kDa [Octopus bimaculoides]XP_014769428.1 centrosomal protein of 55 kDa [Octopus bimaculoides]XP_014769429.1 centrosomal protein of 55 kDa [Octopus bimaculoides]XP_014769430.1 centrosomal protein of 55 kDa [Octopus bimaculoides]|eukprot:XP_014769427.1 PREDICTED: centrosomal protein of 55 kDa-like [Octopus bimaculoides]
MVLQKYLASLYPMESLEKSRLTLDTSDLDKQKRDNHFLTQNIQELKWESEQKDRIIDDLQTIVCNLKCRLRTNNLNDDVQLCEEEIKQDTNSCQNIQILFEKIKLADSIKASVENTEFIERLIKENEYYKTMVTDLEIRLHSNTPTNNFHKIELMNLHHDVQEFAQQCHQMAQKFMTYEKFSFPPMSNDFSVIEENKRLRSKISEVQQANKKWRVYNNQREAFYRKLISQLNVTKKDYSDQSSRTIQSYDDVKKNEEELLALKTQVKIYAEDFENERKDREKAQSRISDLESEILKLKHIQDPPHEQMPLKSYYTPKSTKYFEQKEAVPRGISESHYVNHAYQKDSLEPVRKRADKFETDSLSNSKQNFICPSCNMVFGSDKQAELLAHVDICF